MKPKSVVFEKIARTADANPLVPQNIRVPKGNSRRAKVVAFLAKAMQWQNSQKLNPYNWNLAQMSYWLTFHKTPPKTVTMNIVPEGIYFVTNWRTAKATKRTPRGIIFGKYDGKVKEPLLKKKVGRGSAIHTGHELAHLKYPGELEKMNKKWGITIGLNTDKRKIVRLYNEMREDYLNWVARYEILARTENPEDLKMPKLILAISKPLIQWENAGKSGKIWRAYKKNKGDLNISDSELESFAKDLKLSELKKRLRKYTKKDYLSIEEFAQLAGVTVEEAKHFSFYINTYLEGTYKLDKRMEPVASSTKDCLDAGVDKKLVQETIAHTEKFDDIPKELKKLMTKKW